MPTKFIHIEPTREMQTAIDVAASVFITTFNRAVRYFSNLDSRPIKYRQFRKVFKRALVVILPNMIDPVLQLRILDAQRELVFSILNTLNTTNNLSVGDALSDYACISIPLTPVEKHPPLVYWCGVLYNVPLGDINPADIQDISVSYTKGESLFLKVEMTPGEENEVPVNRATEYIDDQSSTTQTPSDDSKESPDDVTDLAPEEEKSNNRAITVAPFPDISALFETDKNYTLCLYKLADSRLTDRDNAQIVNNAKQARDWARKVYLDQIRQWVVKSTDYYATHHLPVTALDDQDITAGALSRAATNVVLHVLRGLAIHARRECTAREILGNIDFVIEREFCDHEGVSARKIALFKAVARYPINAAFDNSQLSSSTLNLMLMLIRSEWV